VAELKVKGRKRGERVDAVRNRRRILAAAEELFASDGVEKVSMDDIAAAAGVGKGTLYRRFGNKAGLGAAVLDERERDLQEAIVRGVPPLGPGAAAGRRLHAFVDAYLDYLHRNHDLIVMSETAAPGARHRTGVYAAWRQHLALLLTEAGRADADVLADYLLATLAGDLHAALAARRVSRARARAALHTLVDALVR
jgi:AcrR family transcriptional regulator